MKKVIKRAGLLLFAFILSGVPTVLLTTYKVSAAADTCTWTGASSGSLSDGANWSGCDNAGVPEAGDDLIFPSGPSQLNINVDSSAEFSSVTINGAGYTFSGSTLNLSENVTINANNTTFSSSVRFYMDDGTSQIYVASVASNTVFSGNIILANAAADFTFDIDGQLSMSTGRMIGIVEDVFKTGSGKVVVAGTNNNYLNDSSGSTQISAGEWQCLSNTCFGDSGNFVNLSGSATITTDPTDSVFIGNYLFFNPSTTRTVLEVGQELVTAGVITLQHDIEIETQAAGIFNPVGNMVLADYDLTLSGGGSSGPSVSYVAVDSLVSGNSDGTLNFSACNCSLTGSNTFDGDIVLSDGAILHSTSAEALGSTTGKTSVNSGTSLEFNIGADVIVSENFELSSKGAADGGGIIKGDDSNLVLDGSIILAADSSVYNNSSCPAGNTFTLSGVISGSGILTTRAAVSPCSVTISGGSDNSWSGGAVHASGYLVLDKNSAIPGNINLQPDGSTSETVVQVTSSATNAITGAATLSGATTADSYYDFLNEETISNLSSAAASRLMVCQGSNVTLNQTVDATFAGTFASGTGCVGSGDRTVTKEGPATLILSGSDALDTLTTLQVNDGILRVDGNFSGVDANVGNATLKGIGHLGGVSLGAGSGYNAGNSPGCMTLGSLNASSGSTFTAEIAGSTACTEYDQTTVTGAANISGAELDVILTSTPAVGNSFTILSAGSLVGTFNGLANDATFTVNSLTFRINYSATSITLTRVSTPASTPVSESSLTDTGSATGYINVVALVLIILGILVVARRPRVPAN